MFEYGRYGCDMSNFGTGHLINIVIVALVILFFVSLILRNRKGGHHGHWGGMCSSCGDKAIELLKERYVKGEIERAEFEQKKKDLTS